MLESVTPGEAELSLVEALQVSPRAPWSTIAKVLDITPTTAAHRWDRLVADGIAWVTAPPGMPVLENQCLAYIEITCRPGSNLAVAHELARDAHALSVELTAGSADVFVTAAASDLGTMSRYLLERLGRVDGISGTRTRIATRLYTEGSAWRLGTLRQDSIDELIRSRPPRPSSPPPLGPLSAADRQMLVQLGLDGRASYAELAERSGVSAPTARRHVTRLLESGAVIPRTDLAAPLAGYPVLVNLWATAPIGDLAETARQLARLRQVRLCVTLAAAPSLLVSCWLRTVEEVHRFELAIAGRLRQIEVVDRLLVLRTVKRMGRLLDADGRAIGVVPMDVWRDPVPVPAASASAHPSIPLPPPRPEPPSIMDLVP